MEDLTMANGHVLEMSGYLPFGPPPCYLLAMPPEIVQQISSKLPAVWLVCFSNTCKTVYDLLSHEKANKIWYDAMPPSIWIQPEAFQIEEELKRIVLAVEAKRASRPASSELLTWFDQQDLNSLASAAPTQLGLAPAEGYLSGSGSTTNGGHKEIVYASRPLLSSPSSAQGELREDVKWHHSRGFKKVLGSVYDPNFNYKREVAGRIHCWGRCSNCLCEKDSDGSTRVYSYWGLTWCSDCFKAHSVSINDLKFIPQIDQYLEYVTREKIRPTPSTRAYHYYLPEVDEILVGLTGLNFANNRLMYDRARHSTNMARLGNSKVEGRRREVRVMIVKAAEVIWEGKDPFPHVVVDENTGQTKFESRFWMPGADRYRHFRERWAPTKVLAHFLFDPHDLAEKPSEIPHCSARGWQRDPTKKLRNKSDFDNVTDRFICRSALEMLDTLTNWRSPAYNTKGSGGYVDYWKAAVHQWHVERLEEELITGATFRMEHIRPIDTRHIINLKVKLGIPLDTDELSKTLNILETTFKDFDDFERRHEATRACERNLVELNSHFNKMIRTNCRRCPVSGMLFYPLGFGGLVAHMKSGHPEQYWNGTFHCIG
ncbi:MAG: hypothetical protein M1837_004658 [Sclerophora amabilis]|nr:MAG: hypothetical protein M1837_004658 [Sclerophora amabilis]